MKKILLIEDRVARQKKFLLTSNFSLEDYADIIDNCIGEKYEEIYLELKNNKYSNFSHYSLVIVHKGAFNGENSEIHNFIEEQCHQNNIPLVLFSGGSNNYYLKKEHEFMEINSKDFYSENLQFFLENFRKTTKIELLMLSYGRDWKINILLNCLEKINLFIENKKSDDILYDSFINTTNFNLVIEMKIKYYQAHIEDGWVYLSEIKKISKSIREYIRQVIIYEK